MRHYLAHGGCEGLDGGAESPVATFAGRFPDVGRHGSALGAFLHEHLIVGGIDLCTSYYVRGWTSRVRDLEMRVTILVNGVPQGEVVPWFERPDVFDAKGLAGKGFFFAFPRRLEHGDLVALADEFGDVLRNCTVAYEIPPLGASSEHYPSRAAIAAAFLRGRGLEVGAFTQPTDLPPDREILFFDRFPSDELSRFYDADCGRPMMEPSYVGDAERLEGVPPEAFDFVIANHVIEHLLDPIGFLERVAGCLVDGGRAMIAAPDKRYCFDAARALTSFAHLAEDHARGGRHSQPAHFAELAAVAGLDEEATAALVAGIDPATIHVHYHVWDAETFVAFVDEAIRVYALPFSRLYTQSTRYDIIVVLEKSRRPDGWHSTVADQTFVGQDRLPATEAGTS